MILKSICINWFWSKSMETKVKCLGNTLRELFQSRLLVPAKRPQWSWPRQQGNRDRKWLSPKAALQFTALYLPRPPFLGAEVFPLEDEVPVEPAAEVGAGADVLEVVHGDDVDDGAHHARRVLAHALQHRLLEMSQETRCQFHIFRLSAVKTDI